jgi:AMP-polyphosphate phosphotransferase
MVARTGGSMFESAELGHTIDKERYEREEPTLRHALLTAQLDLVKSAKFPVIIVIGGVDGAGKGETLNLLNEWMDPRYVQTNAMRPLVDDLDGRPPMWRFWRVLPPKGRIAIFVGSWYSQPLLRRVHGEIKDAKLDQQLDEIIRFERMLADEGAVLLKFWLHLSRKAQKKRFKELESHKRTAWRVTETDWKHLEKYDRFQAVSEHILTRTSSADAPWLVVEGSDERYRSLTVGTTIHEAMRKRLDQPAPVAAATPPASIVPIDGVSVIDRLDLGQATSKDDYNDELGLLQGRLNRLSRHKKFEQMSVVAVFEGVDAAGKGGAIRRATWALDARRYNVIPIAAPSDEEKARPYLWRFWRNIPERGRIAIFDRSWYGRVLVERVEGFCTPADWMRAYGEINDFEAQLVKNDTVVVKYWLQISQDEQLRRFKEREETAHKQYKITDEDWRNRDKWNEYTVAVSEMIDRTSTALAPWTLVEANDKYFARLKVLRTLAEAIEAAM